MISADTFELVDVQDEPHLRLESLSFSIFSRERARGGRNVVSTPSGRLAAPKSGGFRDTARAYSGYDKDTPRGSPEVSR